VLEASSLPLVGHLDPTFGEIMVSIFHFIIAPTACPNATQDELQAGLRLLFQTKNEVCFAVSGTGMVLHSCAQAPLLNEFYFAGSAGMETLAMNLLEAGDVVVVGVNGVFGGRIREMCQKLGGTTEHCPHPAT
jgi:alanine-glyoxylate transaminase/serine-glyoxylate transaminase/serine-pyruvate transaminase